MVFENKARVQARASLFDAGTEDAQGRTYSQKRTASGLGEFCLGTISRNVPQKYMVKWDEGSSTVIEERHLTVVPEPEAGGPTVTTADDEVTGMSDHVTRDAEVTDDEDEDIDVEGAEPVALADVAEAVITPLNGVVQCGEFRWRRVKAIATDPATGGPPRIRILDQKRVPYRDHVAQRAFMAVHASEPFGLAGDCPLPCRCAAQTRHPSP
jgi:hypothetical protein